MSFIDRTQKQPDVVPPDFRTVKQWVEHLDKPIKMVSKAIDEGMAKGIVIEKSFRVISGRRGLYPIRHYKELPDDKNAATKTKPTRNRDCQHPAADQSPNGKGQSRGKDARRAKKAE